MSDEDTYTINNPMMEQMMVMLNNLSNNVYNMIAMLNNMNNNLNSLKTDMNKNNQDFNERFVALHEKIITKSRLLSRTSSRALSSRHLAVTLRATIPVVIVPTVHKTPPLCLMVPGIESSPSHMDPTMSVTNISVLGSPESLETVLKIPVRTTGSYDQVQACH
jgi:hypothetical protein